MVIKVVGAIGVDAVDHGRERWWDLPETGWFR